MRKSLLRQRGVECHEMESVGGGGGGGKSVETWTGGVEKETPKEPWTGVSAKHKHKMIYSCQRTLR